MINKTGDVRITYVQEDSFNCFYLLNCNKY